MSLPPADVLAEAFGEQVAEASPPDAAYRALIPVADQLRDTLAELHLLDLVSATPAERSRVVELRQTLHRIARDAATWTDAIDMAFRVAAQRTNAKQITTDGGFVVVNPQRGEWKVDVPALRRDLAELVARGVIAQAELEKAITTVVEEKADNRVLNYLAANRGDDVRAVVEAHRHYVDPNPMSAKLEYRRAEG